MGRDRFHGWMILASVLVLGSCSLPERSAVPDLFAAGLAVPIASSDAVAAHIMLSSGKALSEVDEHELHVI